jgi:16S rRNA (guanine527-N7)-methyltransferase
MKEILRYFPDISDEQIQQYQKLEELYIRWNERINLISRKDIGSLYTHHVLHSLAIARFLRFLPKSTVMDVGTGGGFPGIPLAIMFPATNFYLIDSIAKKIMAVNDIIENLDLNNCYAEQKRAEEVKEKFDFIVSRAVTQLPKFYAWVKNNISPGNKHSILNGIIYLKGGDMDEELSIFKNKHVTIPISDYFDDVFFETKKVIHVYK